MASRPTSGFTRLGFTLLEILAVLLIGALLMSFMIPNLSALGGRALQAEAEKLGAIIDLGRQRSVMTATPHRLVIDLDSHGYGLETENTRESDQAAKPPPANQLSFSSDDPLFNRTDGISLSAPESAEREFVQLPGLMGRFESLPREIEFSGVETPGGWVDGGEVIIRFERDGSSSYSTIVLADSNGHEVQLRILPLADTVRIVYEAL